MRAPAVRAGGRRSPKFCLRDSVTLKTKAALKKLKLIFRGYSAALPLVCKRTCPKPLNPRR